MCEKLWSDKLCLLRFRTVIDIVPTRGGIFYISSIRMNCPLPCCGMSCSFLSVCPQFDPRSFPQSGTESICPSAVLSHVQHCYCCPKTNVTLQIFAVMNAEVLRSGMLSRVSLMGVNLPENLLFLSSKWRNITRRWIFKI